MKKQTAFILLSTLLSTSVVSATPLCAGVMMSEISASEMSNTVASLAQMKLRLDMLKAEGSNSQELSVLREKYPIKLAEMQRALGEKYSEKEIRQLLVAEIEKQQGRQKESEQKEQVVRQAEETAMPVYRFTKQQTMSPDYDGSRVDYLPEQKILFWLNEEHQTLMVRDIQSGTDRNFLSNVKEWKVLPGNKALLVRQGLLISKVDIATEQKQDLFTASMMIGVHRLDLKYVDPTGRYLFTQGNSAKRFDLQDGSHIDLQINLNKDVIVLSKEMLLYNESGSPYIYNVETNQKSEIKGRAFMQNELTFLKEDRSQFAYYATDGSMTAYEVKDLSKPLFKNTPALAGGERISDLQSIPGSNYIFGKNYVDHNLSRYVMYSSNNLNAVAFHFEAYNIVKVKEKVSVAERISISAGGDSIAFIARNKENWNFGAYHVHIWEKAKSGE